MKKIKLNGKYAVGKYVLVDDDDYLTVSKYRWYLSKNGYPATTINYEHVYMHRMILPLRYGMVTDHINQSKLDNRKINLREVTRTVNNINTRPKSNNKSGYKGVSWNTRNKKWCVQLQLDGIRYVHKLYLNKNEAIKARKEAERKYFGVVLG